MAIIHAVWALALAIVTGLLLTPADRLEEEAILWMLALQLPTGGAALLLGILGHRYVGGRKHAGPAMWIVGIVPGASSLLHLLLAAAVGKLHELGALAGCIVILIDAIIVLSLRNRILKAPSGPMPVIPILDEEDWQTPGRRR